MADPICPEDCDVSLPELNFSDCAPEINLSQIKRIYLAKVTAASFVDWTLPDEWAERITNTDPEPITDEEDPDYPGGPTGDEIRQLVVIGDKPAPSSNVIDISGGRKYTTNKTHTLPFDIDETNDVNYEAMRMMQCGGTFKMWYETAGGKLYGGNSGITVTVDISDILARGINEIERLTGTFTWERRFDPERTTSPIA